MLVDFDAQCYSCYGVFHYTFALLSLWIPRNSACQISLSRAVTWLQHRVLVSAANYRLIDLRLVGDLLCAALSSNILAVQDRMAHWQPHLSFLRCQQSFV